MSARMSDYLYTHPYISAPCLCYLDTILVTADLDICIDVTYWNEWFLPYDDEIDALNLLTYLI